MSTRQNRRVSFIIYVAVKDGFESYLTFVIGLNRVEKEMGYGYGVPSEDGGFQFGVWEFCPPDVSTEDRAMMSRRPSLFGSQKQGSKLLRINPKNPSEGDSEDAVANTWPIFTLLEKTRWINIEMEVRGCLM